MKPVQELVLGAAAVMALVAEHKIARVGNWGAPLTRGPRKPRN